MKLFITILFLSALAWDYGAMAQLECGTHDIEEGVPVTVQSPNYPDKYERKDKCIWHLNCNNPNGVISISCDKFKLEEAEDGEECKDGDFLRVKDDKTQLGAFCGKTGPDGVTTTGNYMKLKFEADRDSHTKSGFSCEAICTVPTTTAKPPTAKPTTAKPTTAKPTTEQDYSGQCSMEWTATASSNGIWKSPNYDGSTHYPDADYCCWLNVTVPSSFFMVTMVMSDDAKIHETNQCTGDRIVYHSSAGTETTLCGDIGGQSWPETAMSTVPLKFGFHWCSDSTDGGTDIGFQMTLIGASLFGKK